MPTVDIFKFFANKYRFELLEALHVRGEQTYTELANLYPKCRRDIFSWHIKELRTWHFVSKHSRTGMYNLTNLGKETLDLAIQLKSVVKELQDRDDYEDLPASIKLFGNQNKNLMPTVITKVNYVQNY